MATTGATDYEINDPPSDGISRVRFSPQSSNLLVASSWDKVSTATIIIIVLIPIDCSTLGRERK